MEPDPEIWPEGQKEAGVDGPNGQAAITTEGAAVSPNVFRTTAPRGKVIKYPETVQLLVLIQIFYHFHLVSNASGLWFANASQVPKNARKEVDNTERNRKEVTQAHTPSGANKVNQRQFQSQ